jgi:lipoprotein-anchoring transpeptidase ErfK/SrfK
VKAVDGYLQSVVVHPAGSTDVVQGHLDSSHQSWSSSESLDNNTRYLVEARAAAPSGAASASVTSFTSMLARELATQWSPDGGETVGVGMPITLRFNTDIPRSSQSDFLKHIKVTTTPSVLGDWHWFTAREVHWRPVAFWPSGTKVSVDGKLRGVDAGSGVWGLDDWNFSFTIGEKHVSVVDVATHQMQVFANDQLIAQWPISAGRPSLPTLGGTLYVRYKSQDVLMDSLTLGIPRNSPDGYYDHVFWNVAISVDGFYIHAAPWSESQQGTDNVSHGCVNLSTDRAQTYFHFSNIGDVVAVKNTPRVADWGDGEGDWQIPWPQWANSGGELKAPGASNRPGGI